MKHKILRLFFFFFNFVICNSEINSFNLAYFYLYRFCWFYSFFLLFLLSFSYISSNLNDSCKYYPLFENIMFKPTNKYKYRWRRYKIWIKTIKSFHEINIVAILFANNLFFRENLSKDEFWCYRQQILKGYTKRYT